MDTLAHGLWGGAAFGQEDHQYKWAFVLGMCPDLFSFGPFFATRLPTMWDRWKNHQFGAGHHPVVPAYVYHAYNVTHSLVIWAILMAIAIAIFRRRAWPMAAWGLHILCDIPLHSTRFFPTPYLWPFTTPFYDGTPWAHGRFMLWNYSAIGLTYLLLFLYHRQRKTP